MTSGALNDGEPGPAAWYGKLPGTGDFASRRLDAEHIAALDSWLSKVMASLQTQDPVGWLQNYLESPGWKFLWMPEATPSPWQGRAWLGLVMPSVDSVGRYFPLALLMPFESLPSSVEEIEAVWQWLQALDQAAARALDNDWDAAHLEEALSQIRRPPDCEILSHSAEPTVVASGVESWPVRGFLEAMATFAAQRQGLWTEAMRERCYWYCETEWVEPELLSSQGLDAAGLAHALFGRRRSAHLEA